jgi:hypothetical protein
LSELYDANWSYYQGPDCAAESEAYNAAWMAAEEAAQQMEQVEYDMSVATDAVSSQTCEIALAEEGQTLCLDLFIMQERSAFFVAGDNRTYDRNAPQSASRAQLYINPNLCTVTKYVNTSRTIGLGPLDGVPHDPHVLNRATAELTDDGCVIRWSLLAGFCRGEIGSLLCPQIDGVLTIRRDGAGGWTGNVNIDRYPSIGIYELVGGAWQVIDARQEGHWTDLMGWRKHIFDIRNSRPAFQPSPGCTGQ